MKLFTKTEMIEEINRRLEDVPYKYVEVVLAFARGLPCDLWDSLQESAEK